MKNLIKIFSCVFIISCLLFSSSLLLYAEEDTPSEPTTSESDEVTDDTDKEESLSWSENPWVKNLNDFIKITNDSWTMVGDEIQKGSSTGADNYLGIDYVEQASKFEGIFKTFAYTLCLLLFGINMLEKTITYEIWTMKGACNIVGRLFVAKIWIDLSYKICGWIVEINASLVSKILFSSSGTIEITNQIVEVEPSGIPVIGWLVDWLNGAAASIPLLIVCLIVLICSFFIMFRLVIRVLEITVATIVAPPFFACAVGETTQRYFQNYIVTFTGIVVQTLFMAVVYGFAVNWWMGVMSQFNSDTMNWFVYFIPNSVVLIALCVMICKPPKILDNLIRG